MLKDVKRQFPSPGTLNAYIKKIPSRVRVVLRVGEQCLQVTHHQPFCPHILRRSPPLYRAVRGLNTHGLQPEEHCHFTNYLYPFLGVLCGVRHGAMVRLACEDRG